MRVVRRRLLQGARCKPEALAAPGLLPAPRLPARAGASGQLGRHGGGAAGVRELCMDMWAAYMKGAHDEFPAAEITFDRFHAQRLMNRAVDEARRAERKARPELKRSRYVWLKKAHRLTAAQRAWLDEQLVPSRRALKTARAYRIKVAFEDFRSLPPELAGPYFKKWYFWATHSRLKPVIDAARTIKKLLERHTALVPLPHQQRSGRGHQLPRPGRQGQSPRLPHHRELHHHRLSRLRKTQLHTTHLKQRRTKEKRWVRRLPVSSPIAVTQLPLASCVVILAVGLFMPASL